MTTPTVSKRLGISILTQRFIRRADRLYRLRQMRQKDLHWQPQLVEQPVEQPVEPRERVLPPEQQLQELQQVPEQLPESYRLAGYAMRGSRCTNDR